MTGTPVRAAIIGLGRMGSTFDDEAGQYGRWQPPHAHAACFRAVPGVALVAGADPYGEQRAAFSAKWGVTPDHLYDDYHAMLARERPEIVSVCTTTTPRARIIHDIATADVGVRAIWAEKPLAISLAEADEIVTVCRRAGILLAVGASRCWDATYNRMRELIDAGAIGQVLQVNGLGSCTLSHNGSHLLTLVRYLAGGDCAWVSGHVHDDGSDTDFAGNGYLQFDTGAQAFIRSLPCGAAEWEFDVIGTEGRLRALSDAEEVEFWQLAPPTLPGRRKEPVRRVFPRPAMARTANARIVEDILTGLATGKEPNCNGEAARQALEIAIALRESHRRGGARIELPLADRTLRIQSSETLHGDEPVALRRQRAAS
ncbi:MAG: Gfo/Idh/MocA family protein [Thermomicrobiales bacterium]